MTTPSLLTPALQGMLRQSLQGSNHHQSVTTATSDHLSSFLASPESAIALTDLFCNPLIQEQDEVRALAGIMLKNALKRDAFLTNNPNIVSIIHTNVPHKLGHPKTLMRSTAAQILSTLIAQVDVLERGSTILEDLMMWGLSSDNAVLRDGATRCLLHVVEDAPKRLESDECGRPIIRLVIFFIQLFSCPDPVVRERGLDGIALLLPSMPSALQVNMETYLSGLALLTRDPSSRIRTKVLQALGGIFQHHTRALDKYMSSILAFALECIQSYDPSTTKPSDEDKLAREACDFFNSVCYQSSDDMPLEVLLGVDVLSRLVPALVLHTVFSMDELSELQDDIYDDAHVPDRLQGVIIPLRGGDSTTTTTHHHHHASVNSLDDGDDDNDDEEDHDATGPWTLRRAAAWTLQTLSEKIPSSIFAPLVLPTLEGHLAPQADWLHKEAALMSLGAVARGLSTTLMPSLPTLIPLLLHEMETSQQALVRKMACWTLSKFADGICGAANTQDYVRVVTNLIARVQDRNKGVQFAAITSVISFLEHASELDLMSPSCELLAAMMIWALDSFQAKNLGTLLDCIAVFFTELLRCKNVNGGDHRTAIQGVASALWQKFEKDGDVSNPNLLPLLWAMKALLILIVDVDFPQPQAQFAIYKCLVVCETVLKLLYDNSDMDDFWFMVNGDLTFMTCSLDVIATMLGRCCVNNGVMATTGDSNINGPLTTLDPAMASRLVTVVCHCSEAFAPIDEQVVECSATVLWNICRNYAVWRNSNDFQLIVRTLVTAWDSLKMDSSTPPVTIRAVLFGMSEAVILFDHDAQFESVAIHVLTTCARLVVEFAGEIWAKETCEAASLVISRLWLFGFRQLDVALETGVASGDSLKAWTRVVAGTCRIDDVRDLTHLYLGWSDAMLRVLMNQGGKAAGISPTLTKLAVLQCRKLLRGSVPQNLSNMLNQIDEVMNR